MLKLIPNPTFQTAVEIQVPGGTSEKVMFTFKHRTRDDLEAIINNDAWKTASDVENVMSIVSGWDGVDAPFNADTLKQMFQNYQSAPRLITEAYLNELTRARLGN